MPAPVQHLVQSIFAGVQALDVAATASMSDDIVLYDPHDPYSAMVDIAAVREGLAWAFTQMKSMRFDIERWFFDADGTSVVVETSTHHGSKRLDFPQVFVINTDGERIKKMRAYEPSAGTAQRASD